MVRSLGPYITSHVLGTVGKFFVGRGAFGHMV